MLDRWVFYVALIEMSIAVGLYTYLLYRQSGTIRIPGQGLALKRLLFAALLFLILGALPLMFVYANLLWFHFSYISITYFAVLSNATSKIAEGITLYAIARYRLKDE